MSGDDTYFRKILERIDEYTVNSALQKLHFALSAHEAEVESPIEALMFAALVSVFQSAYFFDLSIMPAKAFSLMDRPSTSMMLPFACQVPIDQYRVDFAMWVPAEPEYRLIIECDGHEFHERTKEQAQRDKARDRALQTHKIKILRFAGSEIWRDPIKCALEVYKMVETDTFDSVRLDP